MAQDNLRITSIGHIANQALLRNPSGLVTGKTSQGIYLQLSGDMTLYLTTDPFRGPLTINIRGGSGDFLSIQIGDIADLAEGYLKFRDSQQGISFQRPLIWKPGQPPRYQRQPVTGFADLFSQVRRSRPENSYLALLEMVRTGEPLPEKELLGIGDNLIWLSRSLKTSNPLDISSEMENILGAGPGLTPLCDDLVLGILLAYARTQWQASWSDEVFQTYLTVITAAEEKTTRLSWSLLSCAVQGSADERIMRVLDGLIAARQIPDHDLECLLDWGSSSGVAVLAGILMALT